MAQQQINNGESGLSVRDKLNGMFNELYTSLILPMKYTGVSNNTILALPANSYVKAIFLSKIDDAPIVRLGTTPNGQDLMPDTYIDDFNQVTVEQYFANPSSLYITISGGEMNIRVDILYNFY
jgi:hypothetical protein